jgi:hypothetical protein
MANCKRARINIRNANFLLLIANPLHKNNQINVLGFYFRGYFSWFYETKNIAKRVIDAPIAAKLLTIINTLSLIRIPYTNQLINERKAIINPSKETLSAHPF